MGNLVFLAGDRRLASREATFLLHPIVFDGPIKLDVSALRRARTRLERSVGCSQKLDELNIRIDRLVREERAVRRILEHGTKLSAAQVEILVNAGKPISAVEARSAGIVHELISP
jgi:ATP-dependent protease ClpP protease subunit